MAREEQKKTIGEFTYGVTPLGAIKGRRVFTRFVKVVGPAFAALQSNKDDLGTVLKELCSALSEDDVDYFCQVFLESGATVSGGIYGSNSPALAGIFDQHFVAKYLDLAKWLAFCFEVNFGTFFAGAVAGL